MDKIENKSNEKSKKRTLQKVDRSDTMKYNNLPAAKKGATKMAGGKRKDSNRHVLHKGEVQRKNGTYQYTWTDKEGQRHFKYAPTLEELREKEQQILEEIAKGINHNGHNLTVNDLFDDWIDLKQDIKPSSRNSYIQNYELHVRNSLGKRKVTQIKKTDIRRFYSNLREGGKQGAPVIDMIQNVLTQVFEMALDDGYIDKDPTKGATKGLKKSPVDSKEKVNSFTRQEQDVFFDFLKQHPKYKRHYDLLFVMANTGMRVGEATALQWEDVDFETKDIHVKHSLSYGKNYGHKEEHCHHSMNAPKTKSSCRDIPMCDKLQEVLWKRRSGPEYNRKMAKPIDGYNNFVFLNQQGKPYIDCYVNRYLHEAINAYNSMAEKSPDWKPMPQISSHGLRHSFCTRLCEAGANIKAAQTIMGHTNIRTTMDIYTRSTDDMKEDARRAISDYMQKPAPQLTPKVHQTYHNDGEISYK